jgi:hypothetical protein
MPARGARGGIERAEFKMAGEPPATASCPLLPFRPGEVIQRAYAGLDGGGAARNAARLTSPEARPAASLLPLMTLGLETALGICDVDLAGPASSQQWDRPRLALGLGSEAEHDQHVCVVCMRRIQVATGRVCS